MERNYVVNETNQGIFRLLPTFWLSRIYLIDEAPMIRLGINAVCVNIGLCYPIGEISFQ